MTSIWKWYQNCALAECDESFCLHRFLKSLSPYNCSIAIWFHCQNSKAIWVYFPSLSSIHGFMINVYNMVWSYGKTSLSSTDLISKFWPLNDFCRSAGNGLWLCLLLPVALLSNSYKFNKYSELYRTISVVSIGQFVCAVSNILQNNYDHIPFGPIGLLFSSTIVSLILVFCTDLS